MLEEVGEAPHPKFDVYYTAVLVSNVRGNDVAPATRVLRERGCEILS